MTLAAAAVFSRSIGHETSAHRQEPSPVADPVRKLGYNLIAMKKSALMIGLSAAGFLLLAGMWKGQSSTFDKITVREFELVDDKGQQRASIKVETDGAVVLRLKDHEGTIRVKLAADKNGSGLVLLDDRTEPSVHLLSNQKGGMVATTDRQGKRKEY
jgi:hypothetical protein